MSLVAKRSIMHLYSDPICPYSHRVRMVLAEKGVGFEVFDIGREHKLEDLIDLNPYQTVPTLVDRDLVLYESGIIMEYLDERFPHPPLLPVYPVSRAKSRQLIYRINFDWFTLMHKIEKGKGKVVDQAREELRDGLVAMTPLFSDKLFFMSDEFSLIDCCLAPLLWRLSNLGIEIPKSAKALHKYMERIFTRDSFQASLSDIERELRVA